MYFSWEQMHLAIFALAEWQRSQIQCSLEVAFCCWFFLSRSKAAHDNIDNSVCSWKTRLKNLCFQPTCIHCDEQSNLPVLEETYHVVLFSESSLSNALTISRTLPENMQRISSWTLTLIALTHWPHYHFKLQYFKKQFWKSKAINLWKM